MNFKRRLTVLVLVLALVGTSAPAAFAAEDPVTYAACDMLVNVTTGESYYTKNVDVPRSPASLTKLMTIYMVYEAMERGALTKNTQVRISSHAYAVATDSTASNVPLVKGGYYTVDELMDAALICSACGAACALGEQIAGTESAFAAKMTARARALGWSMTFTDSTGLDDNNRATARSLAALAAALLTRYPDVLNYSSCGSCRFRGVTYKSTNLLLPGYAFAYSGADGLKTGTTSKAGACVAATAVRGGNRLLAVVLGGNGDSVRFGDAVRMLDSGFARAITLDQSSQRFTVNGNAVSLRAYAYGGTNYVSPRDLSAALAGMANAFSVGWDGGTKTVALTTDGTACAASAGLSSGVAATKSAALLTINGEAVTAGGLAVNGTNYFSLRSIAPALGLEVGYDSATDTVLLTTLPPVTATVQSVTLDGKPAALEVCYIGDTGYYKLRDVAMLLSGTDKRFEVVWNRAANSIELLPNTAYTPVGGEMSTAAAGKLRFSKKTGSAVLLYGEPIGVEAYCIGENNYFKLRDLGDALGFRVEWDKTSGTVVLTTTDSPANALSDPGTTAGAEETEKETDAAQTAAPISF